MIHILDEDMHFKLVQELLKKIAHKDFLSSKPKMIDANSHISCLLVIYD